MLQLVPQWPRLWLAQAPTTNTSFRCPGLFFCSHYSVTATANWLLLLAALMPQRWFFDSFNLWLIPKSRHQILPALFFSRGTGIWRWYHLPASFAEVGRVAVMSIDLPMLAVVLFRPQPSVDEATVSP
jgi:hypothetical protein